MDNSFILLQRKLFEIRNSIEASNDYVVCAQFTFLDLEYRREPIRSLFEFSDEAYLFGVLPDGFPFEILFVDSEHRVGGIDGVSEDGAKSLRGTRNIVSSMIIGFPVHPRSP